VREPRLKCAECGTWFARTKPECPECGTANPRGSASIATYTPCAYEANGMRCPLPGVWSDSGYGKHPVKWCSVHMIAERRAQDAAGAAELAEIIAHPDRYRHGRNWRDRDVDACIEGHPHWRRKPDETRSAYLDRMRKLRQRLMPGANALGRRKPSPSDRLADALEEYEERAARLEAEGVSRETAQNQAVEALLRRRIGVPV